MPPQTFNQQDTNDDLIRHAVNLLSQQVWCWGLDILRPEGNWLLEIGFDRIEPPADRNECASIYTLDLATGGHVVLRGFGVFYGRHTQGGVFLPRYKFQPTYTENSTLDSPPWSDVDLPKLNLPTDSQRNHCALLTLELIDWIRKYEINIIERLGVDYRHQTLIKWDNGKRPITPAKEIASAWRRLGVAIAENVEALFPRCPTPRSQAND